MSKMIVFLVAIVSLASSAPGASPEGRERNSIVSGPGMMLTSSGTASVAARETAGPDTFALYGGPNHPTEGKFQLANGTTADWGGGNGLPGGYGGGPDAWTPVDLTWEAPYWHVDTHNAENLNSNGPGNHAMWCGLAAEDPRTEGWVVPPGYGTYWDERLVFESAPVSDPSVGQVVDLDFFFNHDTEPGFDWLRVEYDSAGTWIEVYRRDFDNHDGFGNYAPPGRQYSLEGPAPIVYAGSDYAGDDGDRIRIRFRVTSDAARSNEDGLWPSYSGAAQVDDITVTHLDGTVFEDFEGSGPYLFEPEIEPFAGDFADVYPAFTDIDPCRSSNSPVVGFIDYNQIVRNGPGHTGLTQTGGSTVAGVNYGIVGNWVTNYSGGLSEGEVDLINEVWSPEILWDLPGPADDDETVAGAFIRYDVWPHLPFRHGQVYVWHVRSAPAGVPMEGQEWKDRGFIYFGFGPSWISGRPSLGRHDVTNLLEPGAERVQMALGLWDYADLFGLPGTAATPAPVFDNAAFYKYRVAGPAISTRIHELAMDGFPVNGLIDVSTQSARDGLDIPFNMARDVNSGEVNIVPGDSVTVDVTSVISGDGVTDIRMVWALNTNPVFEDVIRSAPSRAKDENVNAGPVGTVWTGEVVADSSRTIDGTLVDDRFFVDLPDVDFMYPGDVLHYYIQATDTAGRISTLPHDIAGFADFAPETLYERSFTIRGLPTIIDTSGTQPDMLAWNRVGRPNPYLEESGRQGGEEEWVTALRRLGYAEGVDYDSYTDQRASGSHQYSTGLGSDGGHGATVAQISGYSHMFLFAGDLTHNVLSNGTNESNNDKADDIGVLEAWHALSGTRNIVYFGDYIATALIEGSPEGLSYVHATMGVAYGDDYVGDVIGGQTAPVIVPNAGSPYAGNFGTSYVAYGGCLYVNRFDQIQPGSGAFAGHLFTDASGVPIPENPDPALWGAASVINPRANGLDITFPYGSLFIWDIQARGTDLPARAQLFAEILGLFNAGPGGVPVAAPELRPVALSASPNPFNPTTVVRFTAAPGSRGSVKVFNLRGELVRTLHSGEFVTQEFRWDGTDSRGGSVASGVYLIQATDGSTTQTTKVALVK